MQNILRMTRQDVISTAKTVGMATTGALVIAICAQPAFHLPGNPVPITLQVFAVILCGLVLGPKIGALAVIEYLLAGYAGLPVFSGLGSGAKFILGPTGGYLLGFVGSAYITGYLSHMSPKTNDKQRVLSGFAGVLVIYIAGAGWLRFWLALTGAGFGGWTAWALGIAPFIGIDAVKVLLAVMASKRITGKL